MSEISELNIYLSVTKPEPMSDIDVSAIILKFAGWSKSVVSERVTAPSGETITEFYPSMPTESTSVDIMISSDSYSEVCDEVDKWLSLRGCICSMVHTTEHKYNSGYLVYVSEVSLDIKNCGSYEGRGFQVTGKVTIEKIEKDSVISSANDDEFKLTLDLEYPSSDDRVGASRSLEATITRFSGWTGGVRSSREQVPSGETFTEFQPTRSLESANVDIMVFADSYKEICDKVDYWLNMAGCICTMTHDTSHKYKSCSVYVNSVSMDVKNCCKLQSEQTRFVVSGSVSFQKDDYSYRTAPRIYLEAVFPTFMSGEHVEADITKFSGWSSGVSYTRVVAPSGKTFTNYSPEECPRSATVDFYFEESDYSAMCTLVDKWLSMKGCICDMTQGTFHMNKNERVFVKEVGVMTKEYMLAPEMNKKFVLFGNVTIETDKNAYEGDCNE